jgi:hypothetical protein
LPQDWQRSRSLRMQLGQRKKSDLTSQSQWGQMNKSISAICASTACISSSRKRTSSRYSGGRKITYTSVPKNGTNAASVAQPTSIESSIRRLASEYVQNTNAAQRTIKTRPAMLIARLKALSLTPKIAEMYMLAAQSTTDYGRWSFCCNVTVVIETSEVHWRTNYR